jgi:phospholipid/cholesterol/gamma-HCH transport system substrate-binding protein
MAAPTNHWRLGLFVVTGVVMGLATVAILGARNAHTEVGRYVSYFDESVQGLDVGSPIKFRGVTIGTVGRIDIAPDHRHVEVTSELGVADLARLRLNVGDGAAQRDALNKKLAMATDLRVQLASAGLTGVKFLQLDFFDVAEYPPPVLPFDVPDNYIPAAPSTLKNIEDSLMRVMNRLPEVTDQMTQILAKVDAVMGEVEGKKIPEQIALLLDNTNHLLGNAQHKIDQVDTGKLSKEAEQALGSLNETVGRMNKILAHVDGEKGLLSSVVRASDAFGDTVRSADGIGGQLGDALQAVQEAARSIHKLSDALERDPDMLLKGRSRAAEKNR